MQSVSQQERIEIIDVIRGIAIMGILLVNGPTLNGSAIKDSVDFAFKSGIEDIYYTKAIFLFAVGKFYPIFACLFGVSAALFMAKPSEGMRGLWVRRIMCLLTIGCLHASFVWWGDILVVYSILGLSLTILYGATTRFIRNYLYALIFLGVTLTVAQAFLFDPEILLLDVSRDVIYQQGNFLTITAKRIQDFFGVFIPGIFYQANPAQSAGFALYYVQLLSLFVFGIYLFRSGLLMRLVHDRKLLEKSIAFSCVLTLSLWVLAHGFSLKALSSLQNISQGMFYALVITRLCSSSNALIVRGFAAVGRMSMTNYIGHNLIMSLLFYGYGLGLYGRIGPALQAPLLVVLMIASVTFSYLWLKKFRFGPLEWLWRAGTYGKFSPIKKVALSR